VIHAQSDKHSKAESELENSDLKPIFRYVNVQFKSLSSLRQRRLSNGEKVHRLRVILKRLRSAAALFPQDKNSKKLKLAMRDIAKSLGPMRDS
jgi:CHAD domain-containing protein